MLRPGLGYPTLYEVVTSPQIINELSNDEHLSEWHTVAEKARRTKRKRTRSRKKRRLNQTPARSMCNLHDFIPKDFLKEDSSNEDDDDDLFWKEEVIQCCMVSSLEDEEDCHLTTPQAKQKGNGKESSSIKAPKEMSFEDHEVDQVLTSSRKDEDEKGTPNKVLLPRVLMVLRNAPHNERTHYDVVGHLKRIPAQLSVYDALQMSSDHRRVLIQALWTLKNTKIKSTRSRSMTSQCLQ
ncbi:hypothetical protein V2J09_021211 [Rumex salicifolius]